MFARTRWLSVLATVTMLGLGVGTAAIVATAGADPSSTPAVQLHLDTLQNTTTSPDGTTPMGTTPDSSGNNLNATASGTPITDGRFQGALNMNYDDNGITVPDNTALQPAAGVTVMAWVRSTVNPGAGRLIVGKPIPDNQCGNVTYGVTTGASGGVQFDVTTDHGDSNGGIEETSTPETDATSLWNGQWHALAGTYDGTTMSLWVDGVLAQSTSVGSFPLYYDGSDPGLFAGQATSVSGCDESQFHYGGQIDEIRVYGRALSGTEIQYLQNASATTPPELPPPTTTTTSTTPTTTTSTTPTTSSTITTPTTSSTTTTGPAPSPPGSRFTVPPASLLHVAQQTTLTATNTTGASQLRWSVNGKVAATCSAQTPSFTTQFLGNSTVTLTATGPGGSSSTTQRVSFTSVYRPPGRGAQNLITATSTCSNGQPFNLFNPKAASTPQGTVDTTAQGGPPVGCNTTVTAGIISAVGCFAEVSDSKQVPLPEAAILTSLAHDYQTDGSFRAAVGYTCRSIANCSTLSLGTVTKGANGRFIIGRAEFQTVPLYISYKPVRVNGIDFTPLPGGAIVISPAFGRVVSADALVRVKGVPILIPGPVNLDVSDHCMPCGSQTTKIASFDSRGLPGLGDFPLTGQADISLVQHGEDRYSEINAHVQFPPELGGITADGQLRTDNTNGLTLRNFHFHLDSLGFDGVGLSNVNIYFQAPGDWAFYGDLGIGTVDISLIPDAQHPLNGVVFHNGSLDHAGVYVNLNDSPPEIAPGVFLNSFAASFAENPSAIRGQVELTALDVVDVTGSVVLAFPTSQYHFSLQPSDLPGVPPKVLTNSYSQSPVVGIGGVVGLEVPDLGTLDLGSGYLIYAEPGYVAAGGRVNYGYKDIFSVDGGIDGQINFSNKRYNFDGSVSGCVEDLGCLSVEGAVSDKGIGICAGDFGGGFLWSDFPSPHIYGHFLAIGKKCLVSRFEDNDVFQAARQARAAGGLAHAALAPVAETVSRRNPMQGIELDGSTGAVNVAVSGPHGSLTATAPGVHRAPGILVLQSNNLRETVVSFEGGPGKYTITPLPGPTIVGSAQAMQAKPMTVTGRVTGSGAHRVLHYVIASRPGERVTFYDHAHGGSRQIGTTSAARGELRFTAPPGPDARAIQADIAINGVPVPEEQKITVAHYRGPRFVTPGRIRGLRARWHGSALTVVWDRASHAVSYFVTVRERRGVFERFTTRGRTLRLGDLRPYLRGRVTVTAISADSSRGAGTSTNYRAERAAPDRFLPYSELLASSRKHHKTPTKHRKPAKKQH